MKQTIEIEIEVPDGKKAVWKDGKVVFEDAECQLPKTWKEFCEKNKTKEGEYFIGATCNIIGVNVNERNEIRDRNVLPSKQAAKQHLALMQLHQLRDCYRQGWKPNFAEDSQKWFIAKYANTLEVTCSIHRNAFLTFQTKELVEQFLNNFKDLIEQAGDLI